MNSSSKKSSLVFAVAQVYAEIAMPLKRRTGGLGGTGGPGRQGGQGGPGGGGFDGPPAKPLTSEQVSLVHAWIDQGAK